jgi:MFS family permease
MVVIGLVVFTATSLACGVAQSDFALIVARFGQGLGSALASASTLAILMRQFPEGRGRAMALGVFSAVGILGSSFGLLVGGVLTSAFSWHWVFLINIPFGIVSVLSCIWFLERDTVLTERSSLDLAGAFTMTVGLLTLIFGVVQIAPEGASLTAVILPVAAGALLLAVFVWVENRATDPLIPLAIFRSRTLSGGSLVRGLMTTVVLGQFFIQSQYLQEVLGYGPIRAGLAFLPINLLIGVLSIGPAQWLIERYGSWLTSVVSMVGLGVASLYLTREPADGHYVRDLLPAMLLFGFCAGVGFLSTMLVTLQDVPEESNGAASGVMNTAQQLGSALGVAVMATVAAAVTGSAASAAPADLLEGHHAALWAAVLLSVAAAVLTAFLLRRTPSHETPSRELIARDTAQTYVHD